MSVKDTVTPEKIARYLDITSRALEKLKIAAPEKSFGRRLAEDFLNMAESYYNDARHFRDEGDLVTAFAAVNYAHGWLDCGARIGLFDVGGDDVLFTLYE
ncbi:MAG: DUF357 domain-containing protein [Candidatus Methanomethylophilaceae archaeon]|jgi:hypothetical protein